MLGSRHANAIAMAMRHHDQLIMTPRHTMRMKGTSHRISAAAVAMSLSSASVSSPWRQARRRKRPISGIGATQTLLLAAFLTAAASHPHGHGHSVRQPAYSTSPRIARRTPPAFVGDSGHSSSIASRRHRRRRVRCRWPHDVAAAAASRQQDTTAPRHDDTNDAGPAADGNTNARVGDDGRRRAKLNGRLPIISRTVPLGVPVPSSSLSSSSVASGASDNADDGKDDELSVTIWEVEKPSATIELWWSSGEADKEKMGDPFGVVMWPGSILAAGEMHARRRDDIVGKTVLVLGAGTGLEAQAAALLGARRVIATDINALSLRLLEYGVQEAGLEGVVESRVLDLFGPDPLPVDGEEVDLVLVADVLYNQELGMQVGKRIMELLNLAEDRRPGIIVTDSQRFHGTDFTPLLNSELERVGRPLVEWEEREMVVTTSGILIEEDQTYNVTARIISI